MLPGCPLMPIEPAGPGRPSSPGAPCQQHEGLYAEFFNILLLFCFLRERHALCDFNIVHTPQTHTQNKRQ